MEIRVEPFGALAYSKERTVTVRMNRYEARRILGFGGEFPNDLTAPEVVHLEISDRCNMNCDYCYVDGNEEEISTEDWKRIIENLAENKVFQVTMGGGEPFLREDIYDLALYADDLGMNTAVTTNGTLLDPSFKLSVFRQVNFSVHGNLDELKPIILATKEFTEVGMNFVLRKGYKGLLDPTAKFCRRNGIELLILSYKPVDEDESGAIHPTKVYEKARSLASKGVPIAVDEMTCDRCTAARRFVDIDSKGNVMPCSFIREPMGNVLETPFSEIWEDREIPRSCPYSPLKDS